MLYTTQFSPVLLIVLRPDADPVVLERGRVALTEVS